MKYETLVQRQKELSAKLDRLCTSPTAKTREEAELWLDDKLEHLKAKSKNVAPLPVELMQEVNELLEGSQMYYEALDAWYDRIGSYKRWQLLNQKAEETISKEEYKNLVTKTKEHDYSAVSREQKIEDMFEVFEEIIQMQNNSDWGAWFLETNLSLIGDVVWNAGFIDMFAWQLPNADPENITVYRELASIMAIFFLAYRFAKKADDNENPVHGLENILALYTFSRHKH
jgi:hypothetical protein